MKKILIIFFIFFSFFFSSSYTWANCTYREGDSVWSFLEKCAPDWVVTQKDMTIEKWAKDLVNKWIGNIATILWVLAVWSLIYAAILFQFANGEDEKINKAKGVVKWTMIGFLLLISASGIIYVVINMIFGLAW